jgi:hypothetical protein
MVVFIGLNPSTADEKENDPTIRRCIDYAKRWGYQGMVMLNLFAFRATDPKEMKKQSDPVGPRNDAVIRAVCEEHPLVIACWGNHGAHLERDLRVMVLLQGMYSKVFCLGRTYAKKPLHPLYVRCDQELKLLIGERDD